MNSNFFPQSPTPPLPPCPHDSPECGNRRVQIQRACAILRYPCSLASAVSRALLIDRRRHFILRLGNGYARSTTAASLDQQRQWPPLPPPKNTRLPFHSFVSLVSIRSRVIRPPL